MIDAVTVYVAANVWRFGLINGRPPDERPRVTACAESLRRLLLFHSLNLYLSVPSGKKNRPGRYIFFCLTFLELHVQSIP